jgi:hypothetical protein
MTTSVAVNAKSARNARRGNTESIIVMTVLTTPWALGVAARKMMVRSRDIGIGLTRLSEHRWTLRTSGNFQWLEGTPSSVGRKIQVLVYTPTLGKKRPRQCLGNSRDSLCEVGLWYRVPTSGRKKCCVLNASSSSCSGQVVIHSAVQRL